MSKETFSFRYQGKLINGSASVDRHTNLLIPDTIQLSTDTKNIMKSIQDEKEYWSYVDGLCEIMDKTGMFADEVFSIHIVD